MHIVLGYYRFVHAAAYHFERAFLELGHSVTYVGLPTAVSSGYDSSVPINQIVTSLHPSPDIFVWIDPAGRYFPIGIEDLFIPTVGYLIDVHLGNWRPIAARFFDNVFIAQKDYLPQYRRAVGHDQVYWLPLAAASDVHYDHGLERIYDVGFVGSMSRSHRHTARARRLQLITQQFKTNDVFRSYTPKEVGEIYSESKIVFNSSIAGDVTMRVFEGSACGAMVLTDSVANGLLELYEPGKEIAVYTDDADLTDKVNYYLTHESERCQVAQAGHQRAVTQHSYTHRAQQILNTLASPGLLQAAPMRQADQEQRMAARHHIYTRLQMLDLILDDAHMVTNNPLRRMLAILPCLIRRLLI